MPFSPPIILNYTDFPTAAATADYDFPKAIKGLNGLDENTLDGAVMKVLTPFAGTSATTVTISLGAVATPTDVMAAQDVKAAANTRYASALIVAHAKNTQLRARLTITGGGLGSQLSAGRVAIWLKSEPRSAV